MMDKRRGPIEIKSFALALSIIKTYKYISSKHKEFVLCKQLLRSGTAVGALVREAQNAESKKDFIHKLHIAQKECDESIYWIDLLVSSSYLEQNESIEIRNEAHQLLKMIKSAIITSKSNS